MSYLHLTIIYRLTKPINQILELTAEFHSFHIVLHLHQSLHDNHCRSSHKARITFEVHCLGAFQYTSSHQLTAAYIAHEAFLTCFAVTCLCCFGVCIPDSFLQLVLLHPRKPRNSQIPSLLHKFFCRFVAHLLKQ